MDKNVTGRIFDIQHFCTHDGPGIRSTVFFKGCPLSCKWCSNPESQLCDPQLLFFQHLCKQCGKCIDVCPTNCLEIKENFLQYNRNKCINCGNCVKVCEHDARQLSGKIVTVEDVVQEVIRDWRFYMNSGGGITCSGGEPLLQSDFLYELLKKLHSDIGYHTCIETTGFSKWENLEKILPELSYILFDLKHMDSELHKEMTGVGNSLIIENARKLAQHSLPILFRVPLIAGFNDTSSNIEALTSFLLDIKRPCVELMPYHSLGKSKYMALGRPYTFDGGKSNIEQVREYLEKRGIDVILNI